MNGTKTFELREYAAQKDGGIARDFKVGDILRLRDADCPSLSIDRVITYVMKDTDVRHFDEPLKEGWCILGIAEPAKLEFDE